MCKQSTRIWSILLVIIMIINMLPVHALATETDSKPVDKIVADDNVSLENLQIVEELVDRRTEYTKEFRLNNGLRVASVYAYPVHYEENGEWKDIDNTLKQSTAKSGNTYTNTAGIWDVHFPQSMTKDNPVSITKDGHTLSFRLTGEMHGQENDLQTEESELTELPTSVIESATEVQSDRAVAEGVSKQEAADAGSGTIRLIAPAEAVTASVEALDIQSIKAEEPYPEMVSEKLSSRLNYLNLYENTDVVFDMASNMLKESVVIKEYRDSLFGYTYELDTGDMVPVLQEDGAIELLDPENKELVMYMPAPYLIDAAEVMNYDVEVSLAGENGSYVLTYTLPQEWLAEEARQWPVVLDPIVTPNMSINNIQDVTISSGGYLNYTDSYLYCGYYAERSNFLKSWIFLKYATIPELTSADIILDAQIRLNPSTGNYSDQESLPIMEVREVMGTWETRTIRWDNHPDYNEDKAEDFTMVYPGTGQKTWNVTRLVQGWYDTGLNTGMMFKMPDEIEDEQDLYLKFCSSDHTSYYYYTRPHLTIIYRNTSGLESYWDYTSSSAGRAGTGYVNQYVGNLTWVRNDIGFGGNRMPVSINHVYNSNLHEENLYGMGYGWRTNFNQRFYHVTFEGEYCDYRYWIDGDGTKHYFTYAGSNYYVDEDGLELTVEQTDSSTEKYILRDKYGNSSHFDGYGRLIKQVNNQQTPSSIMITYTAAGSFLISTITDGAGRVYTFHYNSDNLLNKISYMGTGTTELASVNFAYDSNSNLITVTDQDNGYSSYTYAENHLLQSAEDIDGYKLSYQYTTTATGQPNRIWTITESDGDVRGTNLGFEYAHNQTKLTEFYGDPTAAESSWDIKNTQLIQFNNMGNTVSVQDDQGRAQFAQYAINDE